MSKLPTGFRPLTDERQWYWQLAEALAIHLDAMIAHAPALSRLLKRCFTALARRPV